MQAYRDEFAEYAKAAGYLAEWRGPGETVVLVPLSLDGAEIVCRDVAEAARYIEAYRLSTVNHGSGTLMMTSDPKASLRDRQVGGDHYRTMCVQPWDALEAWLTHEEFRGYLRGTAIAYLARAGRKGDAREDVAKAVHTLERLLEEMDVDTLTRLLEEVDIEGLAGETSAPDADVVRPAPDGRAEQELDRIVSLHPFESWSDHDGVVLWWLYRPDVARRPFPVVGTGSLVETLGRQCGMETSLWRWSVIPPVWRGTRYWDGEVQS